MSERKHHPHHHHEPGPDGQPEGARGRPEKEAPQTPPEAAPAPEVEVESGKTPAAGPAAKPGTVEEQWAAKTKECEELVDRLQRLAAEYYNYQKRTARQMEELGHHANQALVLDLVPAVDNFERALASAKTEADFRSLRDGVAMVHEQLLAALARHGVTQVAAHGEEFNPEHHEAVAQMPSAEHPEGQVSEVVLPGYQMHGRTIRPSRVVVSSGAPGTPEAGAAGEAGEGGDRTSEGDGEE
jgi:molecular chaperone GrpE